MFKDMNYLRGVVYTLNMLGNLAVKENNIEKAFGFYNQSIELSEKHHYNENLITNYHSVSSLYEENENYQRALKFYKRYVDLRDSIFNRENMKNIMRMELNFQDERFREELKQTNLRQSLMLAGFIILFVAAGIVFFIFAFRKKG